MKKVYVLHENSDWVIPLRTELEGRHVEFEEWFLHEGQVDLRKVPPNGVFYNRMSASSHTRGHVYGPEYCAGVLSWLESHRRRVLNGRRALQLEVSKVEQYMAFRSQGILYPPTVAAVGKDAIAKAAESFDGRIFMTKDNRAGRGLGIRRFDDSGTLREYVNGSSFQESRDGITLLQEFIEAPEPFITRVEFIQRRFVYAVRVDSSQGYELCPADVCQVRSSVPGSANDARPRFEIIHDFESPLIQQYEWFLEKEGIDIAAFEFVLDKDGTPYTYDLNTNTNYNSEAESAAGFSGMGRLAEYLGEELSRVEV